MFGLLLYFTYFVLLLDSTFAQFQEGSIDSGNAQSYENGSTVPHLHVEEGSADVDLIDNRIEDDSDFKPAKYYSCACGAGEEDYTAELYLGIYLRSNGGHWKKVRTTHVKHGWDVSWPHDILRESGVLKEIYVELWDEDGSLNPDDKMAWTDPLNPFTINQGDFKITEFSVHTTDEVTKCTTYSTNDLKSIPCHGKTVSISIRKGFR